MPASQAQSITANPPNEIPAQSSAITNRLLLCNRRKPTDAAAVLHAIAPNMPNGKVMLPNSDRRMRWLGGAMTEGEGGLVVCI